MRFYIYPKWFAGFLPSTISLLSLRGGAIGIFTNTLAIARERRWAFHPFIQVDVGEKNLAKTGGVSWKF